MFVEITNHADLSLKRLLSQYRQRPNLEALIRDLVAPLQDIETVLVQLNTLRSLMSSVSVNLDNVGKIIGLARTAGESDAAYRQKLIAQVKINTSRGQPEQAIQVFQLFTDAQLVILVEGLYASVLMESDHVFPDQPAVDLMINILLQVLPAGVSVDGIVTFDSIEAFAYDGVLPGAGYGTVADPLVGGKYASIQT